MRTPDDVAVAHLRERLAQAGADGVRLAEFDRIAPTVERDESESTQAWSLRTLAAVSADVGGPSVRDELAEAARLIAAAHTKLTAAVPPGPTELAESVSLVRSYLGMSLGQLRHIERTTRHR